MLVSRTVPTRPVHAVLGGVHCEKAWACGRQCLCKFYGFHRVRFRNTFFSNREIIGVSFNSDKTTPHLSASLTDCPASHERVKNYHAFIATPFEKLSAHFNIFFGWMIFMLAIVPILFDEVWRSVRDTLTCAFCSTNISNHINAISKRLALPNHFAVVVNHLRYRQSIIGLVLWLEAVRYYCGSSPIAPNKTFAFWFHYAIQFFANCLPPKRKELTINCA